MSFAVEMNKRASVAQEIAAKELIDAKRRADEEKFHRIESLKDEVRSIYLPKLIERIKSAADGGKRRLVDCPHYEQLEPETEFLTAYLVVIPQWLRDEGFGVGKLSYHNAIEGGYVYTTEINISW